MQKKLSFTLETLIFVEQKTKETLFRKNFISRITVISYCCFVSASD